MSLNGKPNFTFTDYTVVNRDMGTAFKQYRAPRGFSVTTELPSVAYPRFHFGGINVTTF